MHKSTLILAMVILLSAGLAYAQQPQMPRQGGMGYGGGWSDYQATPEQQKAYQKIIDKYQPQFIELTDKLWAKRAQLNGLLADEKIDRSKVKSLAKEAGEILAKSYELRIDMLTDMREQGLSYYGMGMMHGGMMGPGMMMGGGMMGGGMMMGPGQYGGGQYRGRGPGMMRGWDTRQQ